MSGDSGGLKAKHKTELVIQLIVFGVFSPPIVWASYKLFTFAQAVLDIHKEQGRRMTAAIARNNNKSWLDRQVVALFSTPALMRAHQWFTLTLFISCFSLLFWPVLALALGKGFEKEPTFVNYLCKLFVYFVQIYIFVSRFINTFQGSSVVKIKACFEKFFVVNWIGGLLLVISVLYLYVYERSKKSKMATLVVCCFMVVHYSVLCVYVMTTFWRGTFKVAHSVEKVDHDLVDSALRVTVCALVAIGSNLITLLLLIVTILEDIFFLAAMSVSALDNLINVLGLLFIFKAGRAYYDFVFGGLHRRLLDWGTTSSVLSRDEEASIEAQ